MWRYHHISPECLQALLSITLEVQYLAFVGKYSHFVGLKLEEQIWIHRLLKELGFDISNQNTIYTDSQSAIALAQNPEHHARTKHINIQYHFVRNCVEEDKLHLEYCPTEDMVADGLTKALGPERHWKQARMMGMEIWKEPEMQANKRRDGAKDESIGDHQNEKWE